MDFASKLDAILCSALQAGHPIAVFIVLCFAMLQAKYCIVLNCISSHAMQSKYCTVALCCKLSNNQLVFYCGVHFANRVLHCCTVLQAEYSI